jgi:hypothetical protein
MTEAEPEFIPSFAESSGSVLEALNLVLQLCNLAVTGLHGLIGDVQGNHSVRVYFAHGIKGR